MAVDSSIITKLSNALKAVFIQKSQTSGLVKNDGTIDTTTYQEAGDYIEKAPTKGLVKNDGTIDTNTYLTEHQPLTNYVQKSQTAGLLKSDGTVDTSTYLTAHQSLSDIGGEVTVAEKSTVNQGMFKTYQIKQDGTSVGEIDIPKDFLVKSGSVKTATGTSAETAAGLSTGDLYISLVVNSKDSSSNSGEELIIPAASLVNAYVADGSTLQLNTSTNTFSIKNSGVDTAQLKNEAVTSDKIASAVKNTWLTTSNVDTEIEAYLDALAEELNPTA